MAHFAELDESNKVKQVIVVHNNELLDNGVESEAKGIAFCESLFGGRWIQTSYNGNFRGQFAGIDFIYDADLDVFLPPKVEEVESLETSTPPKPDSGNWVWDEETSSWKEPTE